MSRAHELLKQIAGIRNPHGAEIGIAEGEASARLLSRIDLTLIMVDNWVGAEQQPDHYKATNDVRSVRSAAQQLVSIKQALNATRFARERRDFIPLASVDAAELIPDASLDFVWLDAAHSYLAVKADLAAWHQKVRPGGLVSGHDYEVEVKQAVDEWAEANGLTVEKGAARNWYTWLEEKP